MAKRSVEQPSWEAQFAEEFMGQPAQISEDQQDEIETCAMNEDDTILRRIALGSLTRSAAQLLESFTKDRVTAVDAAHIAENIMGYASRLRSLADMMQTASVRIDLAICARTDMAAVREEARAAAAGQEVGHG